MKISIVVPIYNAERTLHKCIGSIMAQSHRDIEIILVDDGSGDTSLDICNTFKTLDKRIQVIHKKNGGVSSARNIGIEYSTGDYLSFVDSDDYLDEDYLEQFFDHGRLADFSMQGYKLETNKGNLGKSISISPANLGELIQYAEANSMINSPWAKLFSRSVVNENKLLFDERISYGEDHLFVLNYLRYADDFYCSRACGYNYVGDQPGSLTNKLVPFSFYSIYLKCLSQVYLLLVSKYSDSQELLSRSYNKRIYYNLLNYISMCSSNDDGFREFEKMKELMSDIFWNNKEGLVFKERASIHLIRMIPPRLLMVVMNRIRQYCRHAH